MPRRLRPDAPIWVAVEAFTKRCLQEFIDQADGNRSKAAELAGLGRTQFFDLLRRHGIAGSTHQGRHRGNWGDLTPPPSPRRQPVL